MLTPFSQALVRDMLRLFQQKVLSTNTVQATSRSAFGSGGGRPEYSSSRPTFGGDRGDRDRDFGSGKTSISLSENSSFR